MFVPDASQQDVDLLCYEAFGDLDVNSDDHNTLLNFTEDHPDLKPQENQFLNHFSRNNLNYHLQSVQRSQNILFQL